MLKGYQFRLLPNREQKIYFANCFGSVRFVYNQMLDDRKEIYETYKDDKELLRSIKPRTYTSYKEEFPFLKEVDNLALANASQNLNKAFKNFYRDKSVGYPKFKSKHKSRESYTTNNQGGNIRIEDGKIKLPKIDLVIIKQHRDFDGLIKSCTISMNKAGNYFISILVEQETPEWIPVEHKIGIDLGISDFAITTNDAGESVKYANPKCLYQSEKKVKKSQRALSRKQKGSKNRGKARLVLAKKHEKIANQRKDFLHKLSNQITDENQVIVIETLRSSNMMKNHKLAKAIGMSVGPNSAGNWRTKPNGKAERSSRRTDSTRPPNFVPHADIGMARKPLISATGPVRIAEQAMIGTLMPARISWLWPSKRKHMRQVLPFEPTQYPFPLPAKTYAGKEGVRRKLAT